MLERDKTYFLERAEAQLELAQQSGHPNAVAAHYHLAELYLDRVYGDAAEEDAVTESAENDAG